MAESKNFRISFYSMEVSRTKEGVIIPKFDALLKHLQDMPLVAQSGTGKVRQLSSGLYGFGTIRDLGGGDWHIEVDRFRKDALPHISRLDGHDREIPLADDELLVERSHLVFRSRYRMIALQEAQSTTRIGRVAEYLNQVFGEKCLRFEFGQMITKAGYERLRDYGFISRAEFLLTRPSDPALLKGLGFDEAFVSSLPHNDGFIRLEVSAGRGKKSLGLVPGAVVDALGRLFGSPDSGVLKRARVTARQLKDSRAEPIDLLEERLTFVKPVKLVGRYADATEMLAAIRGLLDEGDAIIKQIRG